MFAKFRAYFTLKEETIKGETRYKSCGFVEFFGDPTNQNLHAIAYIRANRDQQNCQLIQVVREKT